MIPLYEKCPELGKQLLGFALKDEEGLPDGDYVLIECFCDNPDCDCRNAFIYITAAPPKVKSMAGINYGWESRQYYESVFPSKEGVNQVHGIHLLEGKQSKWADAFLELFKRMVREGDLGEKIKKHYKLFKAAVRRETGWEEQTSARKKIGRNDPCPCGSGKKYKMCCGR